MKNKLLITGVSGFVGSNLFPYLLNKGYLVKGVSRQATSNNVISYNNLTIEDLNSSLGIIHLAGKAHDLKKTAEEKEYFEVNTELTKTLFAKFLISDCTVFIYISSVKAVTDKIDSELNEEFEPIPITPYGKSKLAAEESILSNSLPEGKRVYILRPCMIHGPGNKGNLNLLFKVVKFGIPYPLGKYQNQRSFLTVENLCFVIEKLVQKLPKSGVYNVADDGAISTVRLVEIIADSLSKKAHILGVPKVIIAVISKIGTLLKLPLNDESVEKLTENFKVSNYKIKSVLEVDLPISIEEGLKRTLKSFNKEN